MTTKPQYIYVKNWDGPKGFQHYGTRRPTWIKNHLSILDNDGYLSLTHHDRSVLHGIWILAGRAGNGRVNGSLRLLSKQLGVRVRTIDPLIQAGFITLRASKSLAPRYQGDSPELRGSSKEEPRVRGRGRARAGARPTETNEEGEPLNGRYGLTAAGIRAEAQRRLAEKEANA